MQISSKFGQNKPWLRVAVAGMLAAALMPSAHAASYKVTDLGALPGGAHSSYAEGINNNGVVVGYSQTADLNTHAFRTVNGTVTDLGTFPGGFTSYAAAINDSGQIVGDATLNNGTDHAFLYDSQGFHDLGSLAGPVGTSQAVAINSIGQIAGNSQITGRAQHAFLYSGGKMTDLGTLGNFTSYYATAVSRYGPVGTMSDNNGNTHAFYYNGQLNDIGTIGGSTDTEAVGINDSNQVCGNYYDSNNTPHAFLYTPTSGISDIGKPSSSDTYVRAYAINNNGQILVQSNSGYYLYTIATQAFALTTTPSSGINTVTAFNNAGTVVGNSFTRNGATSVAQAFSGSTFLGALPGGSDTLGLFLNNAGSVVGEARTDGQRHHAFVWDMTNGLQDLGTLRSGTDAGNLGNSTAYNINTAGTIVGWSVDTASNNVHPFRKDPGGALTDLGLLPGGSFAYGLSINDNNQLIGYGDVAGGATHVFYINPGKDKVDIGVLPGGLNSYTNPGCINNQGQIVGGADLASGYNHAFLYYGGFTDLGTLGGPDSYADGINNLGQIVGNASVSSGLEHSFLYQSGKMSDLGLLPSGTYSQAYGINDTTQVVGYSEASDHTIHGYVWNGAFGMRDLNSLVPSGSVAFQFGESVNAKGQITGYGVNAAGNTHAFLLTPSRFDFSGDGSDDILFQSQSTGKLLTWAMNDQTVLNYGSPFTGNISDYKVVGSADFDGDGHPDILFQSQSTGKLLLWLMNGTSVINYGNAFTPSISDYKVVGVADMNGDGHPDILFQSQSTGKLVRWLMNGTSVINYGNAFTGSISDYKVVGLADMNGDGYPDILFQSQSTGKLLRWLLKDQTVLSYGSPFTGSISDYKVVGTGDFNGDGYPDILFQSQSTGKLVRWLLKDQTVLSYGNAFTSNISDYKVVGVR